MVVEEEKYVSGANASQTSSPSFLVVPSEQQGEREALEFARKLFFCCGAAAAPIGAMVATEVKGHGIRQQSPVGRSVPPTMLLIMPAPGENLRERGGRAGEQTDA